MSKKNETTLMAQNDGYLQLAGMDMARIMAEELDGLDVSFERVRIPSSGSTVFEVPGEDGEPEAVKEFSGVILYHHPLYAYYKTKYAGGNNPPDCGSFDGVAGQGDPGGECRSCRHNQFGTGENGSKACKNRRRIYILREGEIFPLLLSLPTGSLRELTRYLKRLLTKGKRPGMVVTRFSLRKATNKGGMVYSQAQFAADRVLKPEEQEAVSRLSEQIKQYSLRVAFDYDMGSDEEDALIDPNTGEILPPLNGDSGIIPDEPLM